MKRTILLSLIILNLSVYAQLNNNFYINTGSWTANSNASIKLAKDLGAKGAGNSVKIVWRNIQDSLTSSFVWTSVDPVIQALQNDTLDMYAYVLCVGPKNSSTNTCNTSYNPNGLNGGESWFPEDTVKWKQFIYAMIDRYDFDGTNDMPGLKSPVNKWRIETEWQSFWCSSNSDTSLAVAKEFTNYINMTSNVIKIKQPAFIVSFAGMDIIHDKVVFYDGYTSESGYCLSDCNGNNMIQTQIQMASDSNFLAKRRNMIYILRNCIVDEIDIHQYGKWKYIPNTIQWYKDSAYTGTKPLNFLEGAGPYCKMCEQIYHSGNDITGILPIPLVRDNSSYVVYWHMMSLANKVKFISWYRLTPDYNNSGASFGDFCLLSMNYVKKPAYYVYRFLAKDIFSNQNADSVVKITESNPNLYHYEVKPMGMNVAWSTNATDSILVVGTGTLYTWDIPTTCDSLYPTACDSVFPMNSFSVSGSHAIALNNSVPVFYSWNNIPTLVNQIVNSELLYSVYPNPNNGSFLIELNQKFGKAKISVTNILGENIFERTITNSKTTVDLGEQSNGIYFICINSEAGSSVRKIIINK